MKRLKRTKTITSNSQMTDERLIYLLRHVGDGGFDDEAGARECYLSNSRRILDEWSKEGLSGTRPWSFWEFHPLAEPKRVIRLEPYTNARGEPEPQRMWPDGHIETHRKVYESDEAYLKRTNLLEDWEKGGDEK